MLRLPADTCLVARREAASLASRPILYVLWAAFFMLGALSFVTLLVTFAQQEYREAADMSGNVTQSVIGQTFYMVHFFLAIQVPLLTMRAFAEERASGMLDLLQTTPLGDWSLLLGKFIAHVAAMAGYLMLALAFPIAVASVGDVEWAVVASGWLALLLASAAYVAIGLFFSATTESHVVAAVLAYATLFCLLLLEALVELSGTRPLRDAAAHLGVSKHLEAFLKGNIASMDAAYFALVAWAFLFLAARILEARRSRP